VDLLERHVELFDEGIRTGDFGPILGLFQRGWRTAAVPPAG
jgi:hypothetical protein